LAVAVPRAFVALERLPDALSASRRASAAAERAGNAAARRGRVDVGRVAAAHVGRVDVGRVASPGCLSVGLLRPGVSTWTDWLRWVMMITHGDHMLTGAVDRHRDLRQQDRRRHEP
jgi:hypothetical protein